MCIQVNYITLLNLFLLRSESKTSDRSVIKFSMSRNASNKQPAYRKTTPENT